MNQRDGVRTGEQSHRGQDLESDRVGSWQSSRVEEARGGGAARSACGWSGERRGREGRATGRAGEDCWLSPSERRDLGKLSSSVGPALT